MSHTIYAYENGTISCCQKESCDGCDGCQKKCNKKHYNELLELCDNENIDCIKRENNCIKCSGYTGYFQLSDGTDVYILPKIGEDEKDVNKGLKIFTNLVENAYSINNIKTGNSTSTNLDKRNLFIEILINIFCGLMDNLFKKGLKKFYSPEEDNLPYLKGKIKFSEHIKRNITSKEKFYCEYDEFTDNIPENRILKTACSHLIKKINGFDKAKKEKQEVRENNKKRLRRFIQEFGDIDDSKNLLKDFSKLQKNRLYSHYDEPLLYAEVFLSDKNYWINKGRKKFPAIMFSLHELFEQYIETMLDEYESDLFTSKKQYSPHYLLQENKTDSIKNFFRTKMDFVLWNKDKTKYLILDAKYKIINFSQDMKVAEDEQEEKDEDKRYTNNKTHISQTDLYQVFTYAQIIKQMEAGVKEVEVALLYPQNKNFKKPKTLYYFNGLKITFIPVNLLSETHKKHRKYKVKTIKKEPNKENIFELKKAKENRKFDFQNTDNYYYFKKFIRNYFSE
ncbi:MAG: McrC family protein [Cyanobacteria bacterium RUI128]|nr:McrC family protein [Cyanobacteria bacterium RUI128]